MTPMEKRVRRVHSRFELDPDWGDIHPSTAEVYQIKVIPSTIHVPKYSFMALLPDLGSEEETIQLLKEVLPDFLEPDDGFLVTDFSDDALEEWRGNGSCGAIMSYDPRSLLEGDAEVEEDHIPNKIDFLWLFPPRHLLS